MTRSIFTAIVLTLLTSFSATAAESHQSTQHPAKAAAAIQYPQIVLYSVSWCPHCREAKEYMTKNHIPFVNRDVEIDTTALDDLSIKYHSTGVPMIIFGSGNDEIVMKGFTAELFQTNLQKIRSK